ncbi:transcriptional regulator, LysR family [Rubellimicrobium mesophilum DSM 19309]|uniref:Transcriptional regulator, LysR family n=1 Tax=Rubellimicrobium mesophilum DSM 19309 TaxID=442562 RepID=A0A017HTK7_9RHOB|nr:LysR family transcriptional regulator [Rubellimicrobium mesophilum]EYD77483.1 transcriptional regulator, LysR family [Rubellimicrobium mesophilum DSM 19309]
MRLEWLEDILAVAETGSLAEAAERRHLSPSAFSRRIQLIENYVGVELFDRSRKPVQLHPVAADYRDRMVELAGALRHLRDDLQRGARLSSNRLVLASQHALTAALTPSLIQSIQQRHPQAYVRLRSANLDECFGLLLSGQADIALAYRVPGEEHPIQADFIEAVEIGRDRLIPVLGMNTPAAASDEVGVVAYPADVFFGQVMQRHVLPRLEEGPRYVPRVETALTLAALELAIEGIGIAWVPASLARAAVAEGRVADLSDQLPGCELSVTAVRLAGQGGEICTSIWSHFMGLVAT